MSLDEIMVMTTQEMLDTWVDFAEEGPILKEGAPEKVRIQFEAWLNPHPDEVGIITIID